MNNKEVIKNNFSRYAKFYDRYSIIQNLCASGLINKVEEDGFKNILDIGCGTANFTKLLRAKFPFARIKAIDISDEMIKLAKKKISAQEVDFCVGDAESINLKEKFDLISSNATFQWFQNLEQALKKYKKILNKRGVILFSIFGPLTFYELQQSLEDFYGKKISLSASFFMGRDKIKDILKSLFSKVKIEQQIYKEKSNSLTELLKKIKYSGTRGVGLSNKRFWTHKTISELENIYRKNFKDLLATYQVFFCRARA